jgi:hypothetical protein
MAETVSSVRMLDTIAADVTVERMPRTGARRFSLPRNSADALARHGFVARGGAVDDEDFGMVSLPVLQGWR